MPRSARSSKPSTPEPEVPRVAPPRMRISLVSIRAEDVLPNDIVFLQRGPRPIGWRKVAGDITQSGAGGRIDIPYTDAVGMRQTVEYGPYDLIKLQIEKEL
jgi:hypothetical protein